MELIVPKRRLIKFRIQHAEHGESLKSKILTLFYTENFSLPDGALQNWRHRQSLCYKDVVRSRASNPAIKRAASMQKISCSALYSTCINQHSGHLLEQNYCNVRIITEYLNIQSYVCHFY